MAINILFADVTRSSNPKAYIKEKLAAAFAEAPEADLQKLAENAYRDGRALALPTARAADHPKVSDKRRSSLALKTRMFVAAVDELSPLLPGEVKQEDDFCTYLAEDFLSFPKHTPVLLRKTDRATIGYVFQGVSIDVRNGEVQYRAPVLLGAADGGTERHISNWLSANLATASPDKAQKVIGQLAKALVGMLPGAYGKVGAALLNMIIPSGGGIDYNQLLDEIGTIIKDANRRQTIATQGGILNGIVSYVNGNYLPQRDATRSSKSELFALLNQPLSDIYKVIGILEQEEFAKGGISTFLSAVTHKFALYQEMAVQDPNASSPKASSKAVSICKDAKEDAEQATRVIGELQKEFDDYVNDWVRQVSDIHIRITDCPKSEYYFHDGKTDYRSPYFEQHGCKDDPRARAVRARNEYIARIRSEYAKDHQDQLPWMREVVEDWRRLIDNPIPGSTPRVTSDIPLSTTAP